VGNKYFINKKVLTPELSKALQEAKADQIIPVDLPANIPMSDVLQPVQRLATPSDNYVMEDKMQGYVQQILGISDLQAGSISSASRVPAAAVQSQMGAQTTRAMEKTVNVERASREIATRMLALCQQFLDDNRAVRIAGPNAPTWFNVTPEDIDGEFSIEAEGGSTQSINPAQRAQQGLDILQNIVPTLANFGYDPQNAMRMAISYLGLNPDHLLVRPEPQPQPEQAAMSPEMGQGQPPAPTASMVELGGGVPSAEPTPEELAALLPPDVAAQILGPMDGDTGSPEELASLVPPDVAEQILSPMDGGGIGPSGDISDLTEDELEALLAEEGLL
jgi:hypothetical protein